MPSSAGDSRRLGLRFLLAVAWIVTVAAFAQPAAAGHWDLGANFSLGVVHYMDVSTADRQIYAFPGGAAGFQPGLRMGWSDAARRWSMFVDGGFYGQNTNADDFVSYVVVADNLQRTFRPDRVVSPFLDVGLGLVSYHESWTGGQKYTGGALGAGVGVRERIAGDHGAFREELRLDRFTSEKGGVGSTALTLRLGFDLWLGIP
jgi:hypothetical protein